MDFSGGGNWSMIPNIPTLSNSSNLSNQESLYLQQQQFSLQQQQQQQQQQLSFHHQPQQFQPQIQPQQQFQQQQSSPQFQQLQPSPQIQPQQQLSTQFQQQMQPQHFPQQQQQQQQQQQYHFQQQQQRLLQQQQQQQQKQQQYHQHQSLASHFHLFHFVEKLADAIETGVRDQQSDALVNDLNNHFEKCQQLLNSISGSLSSKAMTVEGQKKKLEEHEQLLSYRRELIGKYKSSVEELVKGEP
ncbi:hypothetical protein SDJN03_00058, partial [Cucurbita argyrosperma subsp. sororia]